MKNIYTTTIRVSLVSVSFLVGCTSMFGLGGPRGYTNEIEENLFISATNNMADTVWNILPAEVKTGKFVIMSLEENCNPFFEDVFMSRWLDQGSYIVERRKTPLMGLFFEKGKKEELLQKWQQNNKEASLHYDLKQPSQIVSGDYILGYWDRGFKYSFSCLFTPLFTNQTYKGSLKVDYHLIDTKDGRLIESLYLTTPASYTKKEPGCLSMGLSPKGEMLLAIVGIGIIGGAGYYINKTYLH